MNKINFLLIGISLLISTLSQAYITKSGNVSGEYWHNTDTYYISGSVTVDAGSTFEIQAGTVVKFSPGASITVNGTIICNGNASFNIFFTSRDDDSVGETITGSDGNPSPGDWSQIYVNGLSSADGVGTFSHVEFSYGGSGNGIINFYYANTASLQNCLVRFSESYGAGANNSDLDADNSRFSYNAGYGIFTSSSSPTIDNCEFYNNGNYAAYLNGSNEINIYSNNTGSNNTINAFGISGTIDQDYILSESVCGFPFVLTGLVTLNENNTLTIPAGEVIKATSGGLIINGTLNAIGTNSQNIVFTSLKDDTYGGDLNGDGAATTPAKGDWSQIMMSGSFAKQGIGNMDYCKVLYAGSSGSGAVNFSKSDEEGYFKNGTIQYSESRGLYAEYVTLEVTNNQFLDNDLYGVYAYVDAVLDLSNSTFNNNGNHGINASSSGELQINNCQFNNNGGYAAYLYNIDNLLPFTNNTGSGNTINAFGISGTIDQDYTLSQSITGFPFVIAGNLTMKVNYTLTIPPGEVIKFSTSSAKLTAEGTLDAQGTASDKIVFTSLKDDTYGGDLNGDGDATNPAPGDWAGLNMYGNYDNDGKGYFDHCIVRYAGTTSNYSSVYFNVSDSAYIKNSIVEYSQYDGIRSYHSDPIIENCSIHNNGRFGINIAYGLPQINNCQINSNGDYAAYMANIDVGSYTGNSGTDNAINAFGINTGTIKQDLTFSESVTGFPYVLLGAITVNDDVTLTIPPGEIIKASGPATKFITSGTIDAQGSETQKIVFTSLKDDTFGGDLNGDGDATSPAPGNWAGVNMSGIYDNDGKGYFNHCIVRYAGTSSNSYASITFNASDSAFVKNSIVEYSQHEGIEASYSDLVVENCSINHNGTHGIYINSGKPQINNCEFNNNDSYAAYLDNVEIVPYTNNTGSGNAIDAFGISGDIKQDLTLSQSITGFPFVLVGDVTVYDNCKLTIPPGEIIKLSSLTTGIQSKGTIDAQGANEQPIIFTSFLDDSYGGDLNGDGDATSPAPGDWEGILLNGTLDNDGNGFFDHCVIRYGGISNNSYSGINFYQSDSAFIKNSVVEYSLYDGLRSNHSAVLIKENTFNENTRYGVIILGSTVPNLGQNNLNEAGLNTFINNDGGGIQLYSSSSEIDAYYNDWGYYTEAEIDAHIYDDDENASYGEVHFNPWYDPASPPFVIDFEADETTGTAPFTIQFTNLSNGSPSTWEWDFDNDGTIDSEEQNPVWEYTDSGLYTVALTVDYGIYSATETKIDFIEVNDVISIYDIQYTTDPGANDLFPSPYEGQTVITTGIVTATGYNGNGNNFFISSASGGAWEGIYVYNASGTPAMGDSVVLEGQITEYYGLTEVHTPNVAIISSGHTLPDPALINTGDLTIPAIAEPWEGSIVKVENVTVTLEPDAENEWYVSDGSGDAQVDNRIFSYTPVLNQQFDFIIGALDYSWDEYGINPRFAEDLVSTPDQPFALSFDGNSDFVKTGGVPYPTDDLTIEAWIYPTNMSEYQEIVFYYEEYDGVQFRLQDDGSLIYLESANSGYEYVVSPAGKIQTTEWTHVAVTKAGDLCTLYINGLPSGFNHFDRNPVPDTISIGARSKYMDRFFEGYLDDIRIWSVARTQAEIQSNMGVYPTGTEPGLYVYYQLNDGPGQITHDLTTNGFDGDLGSTAGEDDNDPAWIITEWPHPYDTGYVVDIKAYLEGPFNGTSMNTTLWPILPLAQPYNTYPWEYDGDESVASMPANVVDWLLVEYRDATDANSANFETSLGGQAAFILEDGQIVDLSGNTPLVFNYDLTNNLYVVLWHRNHLPILSSTALNESGGIYNYDFTTSAGQAYGNNQADLEGAWGMIGGDANADGVINEFDGSENWIPQVGQAGYLQGDINMDTQVNNQDKNDIWYNNYGKTEVLPVNPGSWSCSEALIDPRDGQSYNTVEIGSQCWMAKNLNIGTMTDVNNGQGDNGSIEKYCYDGMASNCDTYGGLYQWSEIMEYTTIEGTQGICPDGWHIPTFAEWDALNTYVGLDGNALKAIGQGTNLGAGTNSSGFSALLGGTSYNYGYENMTSVTSFWTSTNQTYSFSYRNTLNNVGSEISGGTSITSKGYSVRCIKD